MRFRARLGLPLVVFGLGVLLGSVEGRQPDDAMRGQETAKHMRELAIAIHNYHNDHGSLPPAGYGQVGKPPLLSWRVLLLPYLGQKELFEKFQLTEPWNSDNNKKLLEKMPAIYAPVGLETKEKYTTFYQVFVGPGAPFETDTMLTLRMWSMADGSSNTFMIVEGGVAVPWSQPADLKFETGKPLPKLGGAFKDGFHACFGDGSVRFVKREIPDHLTLQLLGWNDGLNENVGDYIVPIQR
jgi:hypothetical protein